MTDLEKLVEKDAIRDQYYVYARALDRIDNPLGKTVFAEDAQVDYGPTYKGTGYGFIDMMLKMHRKMVSTHHVMTNILIKLNEDGTKAAAVTAVVARNEFAAGYLAVEAAAKLARHESWTGASSVGFSVVRQETMYSSDNQKLLFPVT